MCQVFLGEDNLITENELEPYLNYWVKTISNDLDEDVRNVIYHYINRYSFSGTQELFGKFGKDILPKTDISTTKSSDNEDREMSL
jgi:hypothetical protein